MKPIGSARISECGKYRYELVRHGISPLRWVRPVLFIMLNPSTADADQDDATIRKCIKFAARMGGTRLTVVNLFALRSTDPRALRVAEDPEGPCNDGALRSQVESHRFNGIIIAAWGNDAFARRRAEWVTNQFGPFQCLGRNKNGSPKHPLYLRDDSHLEAYP
jgi:hypothetical protein